MPRSDMQYGSCILKCICWRVTELPVFGLWKMYTKEIKEASVRYVPHVGVSVENFVMAPRETFEEANEMVITEEEGAGLEEGR